MCLGSPSSEAQESRDPALALVSMMGREMGVSVDKYALALFLKLHWDDVARLAHEIHGSSSTVAPPRKGR